MHRPLLARLIAIILAFLSVSAVFSGCREVSEDPDPVVSVSEYPLVEFNGGKYFSIPAENGGRLLVTENANELEMLIADTLCKYLFNGVNYSLTAAMTATVTDAVYVSDKKAFFLGFVPRRDPLNYTRSDYTVFSLVFDDNEWFVADCTEFDHSLQVFERIVSETQALRRIERENLDLIKDRVLEDAANNIIAPRIETELDTEAIISMIGAKRDASRSDKLLARLMMDNLGFDGAHGSHRMYSNPAELLKINVLFIKMNTLKRLSAAYPAVNAALFEPESDAVYPYAVAYFEDEARFEMDYIGDKYHDLFIGLGS